MYLVKQGIADPNRIAIVGWSYGGYAALESEVLHPGRYKAVVSATASGHRSNKVTVRFKVI